MKTLAKIIGALLLLLVVAIIAITLYVKFFFDPNDLRSQITQQVKERTGRELIIEGDFALSTFPWISVDMGQTRLSDDPGFNNDTLLSFSRASASIKLMPLLKKQIELGTTTIEGANIVLITSANGINNWDAFLAEISDPAAANSSDSETSFKAHSLGAVKIVNANVSYTDQTTGQTMQLSDLNLSTGDLVPEQPFDVELTTGLMAEKVDVQVALSGVTILGAGTLAMAQPQVKASGSHYSIPFGSFDVSVDGEAININETTYQITAPSIKWNMKQGRAAAATVAATEGGLVADQISLEGEILALSSLVLDFDVDLSEGAAKSATGKLTAASVSGKLDDLMVAQPVLNFDSALTTEGFNQAKGVLKGRQLTVKDSARIGLSNAKFDGEVDGDGLFENDAAIKIASEALMFNVDDGAMQLNNYTASLLDLNISGTVRGKDVLGSPQISGPIEIAPFNLRSLLQKAEVSLDTADPQALGQTTVKGQLSYTEQSMGLTDLIATLDQSSLSGSASLNNGTQVMDLSIDTIDLDRYLSPVPTEGANSRAVDEIEIPAQQLRELNARGRLRIGALTMSGIESQNVDINLDANNGAVRVFPVSAQMYGGRYAGDIQINATGEVPKMSLNERFENVDIGELSMALADSDRVTGRITGSLVMTAEGHNTSDLKASSDGQAEFSITDGVLKGVNFMETVRNIVAAANKEPGVADEPDVTEFRKLSGTAQINRGVLSNQDLAVEIPLMRVNGEGTLDLNTKAINYRVGAKVIKEADVPLEKELRFISDYTLPLYISGTYEAPEVDKTRSITDLAKQHVKKKAKERILDVLGDRFGLGSKDDSPDVTNGDTSEDGAQTDGVSDASAEKPDGIPESAQPEEPLTPDEELDRREQELKDKLDDKLKDKFKDLLGG